MSTNTIVSDIIAEHDARQRTQQTRTPKEVHARMIEMTNAANGLRYEIARFGDIERQLKAVHEKMEPLVLKAKELNDLICERVSQASQPWAIHESEELVQKVQQLETENAALREARKPVAVPGLHGLVTWYADAQQLGEAFQREREKCIRFEEVMQSQGDEIRRLTVENDALHKTLSAAIDAARKEDQP